MSNGTTYSPVENNEAIEEQINSEATFLNFVVRILDAYSVEKINHKRVIVSKSYISSVEFSY